MPMAGCQASSGIWRSLRQAASVRFAAMAKSAPFERAAKATSLEKNLESPRTIGRKWPSGRAAIDRLINEGAWGRGSDFPDPRSAASAHPASTQMAGWGR